MSGFNNGAAALAILELEFRLALSDVDETVADLYCPAEMAC